MGSDGGGEGDVHELMARLRSGDMEALDPVCAWAIAAVEDRAARKMRDAPENARKAGDAADYLQGVFLELRDYLGEDPARTPWFSPGLRRLAETMFDRAVIDQARAEGGQGQVKRQFSAPDDDHSAFKATSYLSLFRHRLRVRELIEIMETPHRVVLETYLEHSDDPVARDEAIRARLGLPDRRAVYRPLRRALEALQALIEADERKADGRDGESSRREPDGPREGPM